MSGKFFVIRSNLNGLVLDVQNGSCSPGNPVKTWDYNGGDNQLWFQDFAKCCIRSAQDENYCLEIMGGELCVNYCNDHECNQRFEVQGDAVRNRDDGNVLDIADHNADPGARICTWSQNGGPNQSWSFDYQPPRYCYIKNVATGKALDVADCNSSAGANVVMWDFNGGDNQTWYEDNNGAIRSKLNDFAIDVSGGSAQLYPFNGSGSQMWCKSGQAILNRFDAGQCIDVKDNSDDNGAELCQWGYKGSDNQHFDFEYC